MILLMCTALAWAQPVWEQKIEVPARVTYKKADLTVVKAAAEKLDKLISGESSSMLNDLVMLGPFAWDQLGKLPALAEAKGIPVSWELKIGGQDYKLPGRAFRSKDGGADLAAVDKALRVWLSQDGPYKVRLLSPNELNQLWTLWPFDSIDEPIFVAESARHKLVVNYKDGDVFFVDDFLNLNLSRVKALSQP